MLIDLHVHSDQSDGSLSPEELIDVAVAQGINTLALTDHDTTAGLTRFLAYGSQKKIIAIPGIELSATWKNKGNCHFVAYGIPSDNAALEAILTKIRQGRDSRNAVILTNLEALGISLAMADVAALAGGEVISRPHFAQAMVARGYVASVGEAFERYLGKGAVCYANRFRLDPQDAVRLLSGTGALVVLAHPCQLNLSVDELEGFIATLKPQGLCGIEVYSPYAKPEEISQYTHLSKKYALLITGGSDFHGFTKPDNILGYYADGQQIPVDIVEHLFEALKTSFQK
jgi:predicted metal-dependent phosphoesterase TrpH